MADVRQLARDLVVVSRQQADERIRRSSSKSEIGRVVGTDPLRIRGESFAEELRPRDLIVGMGAQLEGGMLVELTPSKGGTWIVLPLEMPPDAVSSDPTIRGRVGSDLPGSGAAQTDQRSIDPSASASTRVIQAAKQSTPLTTPSSGSTNSKGYIDPMGGARATGWGPHGTGGNGVYPWAGDNATDIFAAAGTMTVALARVHVWSVGDGRLNPNPAYAGQGAYLREVGGRLWWYRHIELSCRVGQYLEPGAPVGRLVAWTNGGAHLHLGTSEGGRRGVLDAKPDGQADLLDEGVTTKVTGNSSQVAQWATAAGYAGVVGAWAGIFVHHVYSAAKVSHGGVLNPPRAGDPAEVFKRGLAAGFLSDLPKPGCIIVQGEVKEVGNVLVMTRAESIFIFVSGTRSSAVMIGGNLGPSPGEVKQVTRAIPAKSYFAIVPSSLAVG